ncbi:MAG: HAMP domain-containing histidine kinase [Clostridia bacterium]|nr:HAMP domain-containing histidine kinase [Clostridia bacterium]
MLKKLKIRLILNNMLILGIVFALLFSAFSLLVYIREEIKITNALKENIVNATNNFAGIDHISNTDDKIYDVSLTLWVTSQGQIINSTQTELDVKEFQDAINYALKWESDRGNYLDLNLSFLRQSTPNGIIISFLSREHINERLRENLSQGALAGLIFMLVFGFISIRLASIALAPVEKAWEQQKQFIADASHDLKTPLTVILANNNIISSHTDETVGSQMKWIESTNEEAKRMSDLINKMLELAKSEATKEELKLGEINLSEVVENSILQFEVVAFEKNVSIESGIQPNIIVRTNAPTFSKVLEILFDNAIKYSDPYGKISITLYQSSKKVYFTINNRGEYIKPEELPHVFERFYRTNKERKVGGHGLGLSLAKKKCDMIGCKLSVESNEEDGTTFTITLKARKQK